MKNEKMLQEMLSDNFIEISRKQIEGINGGGWRIRPVMAYDIKTKIPKALIGKIVKAILK